jgi:hypothetical protein
MNEYNEKQNDASPTATCIAIDILHPVRHTQSSRRRVLQEMWSGD